MYLTSSFVFHDAAEAARRFSGEEEGMVYSRYTNPTVQMLETRLAALEGAESCVSTASGMSAILAAIMSLMKAGEHIVVETPGGHGYGRPAERDAGAVETNRRSGRFNEEYLARWYG